MTRSLSRRAFGLSASALGLTGASAGRTEAANPRGASVVELFTSQLCPGCPVADAYLIELAKRPELIPLSFSVTHYDRGDFKDPFGQEAFSQRHFAYARAFHHTDAFTPDIVINGHADAPGMATGFVEELLVGAELDGPAITAAPGGIAVAEGIAPAEGADVWVAHYDPRVISVPIRGSSDRSLPQINVVRGLYLLGEWNGLAAAYAAPPLPAGLKRAAAVQTANTGPILAAARI